MTDEEPETDEEALKVLLETRKTVKEHEKTIPELKRSLDELSKRLEGLANRGESWKAERESLLADLENSIGSRLEELREELTSETRIPEDVVAEAVRKVWDQTREELRAEILKEFQEAQKAAIGKTPLEEAGASIVDVEIDEEGLELDLDEGEPELVLDLEEEEGGD